MGMGGILDPLKGFIFFPSIWGSFFLLMENLLDWTGTFESYSEKALQH